MQVSYTCFWQGNFGCLAPLSPPCWRAEFEIRRWSNVVCAAEQALASELMKIAAECETSISKKEIQISKKHGMTHPLESRRPADLIC
jgi:hypothetical protein